MRYILIDLSSDNYLQQPNLFGGYEGEHNETILQVKLPKRMIDIECSGYRFDFQTSEDNKISSPLIPVSELNNDILSFHLTQQLTIAGKLLFNVVAILSDENTVSMISKTNTVTLRIEDAADGNIQLIDPNGTKDELQKMVDERIRENIQIADQTYNAESENAQSGIAVAEAVKKKVNKLNLSKVETLDKFTNATKGLYISNSWDQGEARLAKLSYESEPNTVACRGGDGQIPVGMYGNDSNGNYKIWKGNAIPSEFFTYWFHYFLNGDLQTLKGKTKTLEEGAKLQNETIANKKITSAYNNRQLDWNSMYLLVSNTGDFDIQIYDNVSKSVVLDGDGNALPASRLCLLILPKENTRLDNNGKQGKLCMFVGITGKSINIASNFKALQFSIKNNANLYLPDICQVSTFKIGL